VLGLIALGIGVESVLRLFQPITVAFGEATIIAVVGLGGPGALFGHRFTVASNCSFRQQTHYGSNLIPVCRFQQPTLSSGVLILATP
jgi:hypothetical protein